MCWLFYFD
jgi:hypothetical protein